MPLSYRILNGMYFQALRMSVVALTLIAQLYLLVRSVKAVRSRDGSPRVKLWQSVLVGTLLGFFLLMNVLLLIRPVPRIDPPQPIRWFIFYLPAVWSFGSIFAALVLLSSPLMFGLVGGVTRLYRTLLGHMELSDPPDPDRRRFLQIGVGGLATAPFVLSGFGAFHGARAYEIREVHVPFGRTLRVVQLTDIHAGIYMTRRDMRRYVDQVRELQPDLFVLTGDYVSSSIGFLPGCLDEMGRVRARYGTFAILGNHDLWYGKVGSLRKTFKRHRIPLLVNQNRLIETEQGPFAVVGIDDIRSGFPDLRGALKSVDGSTPTLLLSHRPEIFPEAAGRGIRLTLAGHYHGGQIKLPLPGGALSLAQFRTPYVEGLHRIDASYLYVSAGIGTTFTPVRLNAPPEVTVVHLTA
ncbi:MAG: metallophosphoesterase [Syntrophobacteraceae bacterium]